MNHDTIMLVGGGPSVHSYKWVPGERRMAISSGVLYVPDCVHFVSHDRPVCFPRWVTDSDRFITHVPKNIFGESWQHAASRVKVWSYRPGDTPDFCGNTPLIAGPLQRNDSMLLAVQVAARLGFRRLEFIGCDLLDNDRWPISDVLKDWHGHAKESGIEWVNLSPISTLREWMPSNEEVLV